MSTYLPDYGEIVKATGIPRCRGLKPNGQRCYANHDGKIEDGLLHWRDRRTTKAGIYRFLHLGAMIIHASEKQLWRRHYLAHRTVARWSADLGIRYPPSVTAQYRSVLKSLVVGVGTQEDLREEAMRWASKS